MSSGWRRSDSHLHRQIHDALDRSLKGRTPPPTLTADVDQASHHVRFLHRKAPLRYAELLLGFLKNRFEVVAKICRQLSLEIGLEASMALTHSGRPVPNLDSQQVQKRVILLGAGTSLSSVTVPEEETTVTSAELQRLVTLIENLVTVVEGQPKNTERKES